MAGVAARKKGETPPLQRLMRDSRLTEAERRVQPIFSNAVSSLAASRWSSRSSLSTGAATLPDRSRAAGRGRVELVPVALGRPRRRRCGWSGAWRLTPSEPRFGGLSALAIDGGELLALTDSGVVAAVRSAVAPRRGRCADRATCPTGRATPASSCARQRSAAARSRRARLVGRRSRIATQLWLFDQAFRAGAGRVARARRSAERATRGIEALAVAAAGLVALPESGGSALRWGGGRWSRRRSTAAPDVRRGRLGGRALDAASCGG